MRSDTWIEEKGNRDGIREASARSHVMKKIGAYWEFTARCVLLLPLGGVDPDGASAISWEIIALEEVE